MAQTGFQRVIAKKGLGVGGTIALGMNAFSTISDYKQSRMEGHSVLGSGISAAGNAVMFEAIGWKATLGLGAIKAIPSMAVNGALKVNAAARQMDRASRGTPFANSTFVDSQQAYTMRQAGMQLAQASKYNLQQTMLGNEASVMKRL